MHYGNQRNIYIDWLRGFSILSVLGTHGLLSPHLLFFLPPSWAKAISVNGYYGVTIFFVISGFLITSRALHKWETLDKVVPSDFYAMRVGRIVPLLLLFLTLMIILAATGVEGFKPEHPMLILKGVSAALTFQYNYFYMAGGSVTAGMFAMAPLWSLSIEEAFYVAFPLVIMVLKRRSLIVLLLLAMIIQGPFSRVDFSLYSFSGCVDALSFGCLAGLAAGWLADTGRSIAYPRTTMAAAFSLVLTVMIYRFVLELVAIGPTLVAAGTALFVTAASFAKPVSEWNFPKPVKARSFRPTVVALGPIAFVGALSYELYLFHMAYHVMVPAEAWRIVPHSFTYYSVGTLLVLVPFAYAINHFFTEPMNRLVRSLYFGTTQQKNDKVNGTVRVSPGE